MTNAIFFMKHTIFLIKTNYTIHAQNNFLYFFAIILAPAMFILRQTKMGGAHDPIILYYIILYFINIILYYIM